MDLATGLQEKGVSCLVLCPNDGLFVHTLEQFNIPVYQKKLIRPQKKITQILLFAFLWIPKILDLAWWMHRNKISIVYNNTIDGLYAPFSARLVRIPCIWHVREVKPNNQFIRKIFTWLLKYVPDRTVFNSMATMQAYSQNKFPKWSVIYNGIDFNNISIDRGIRNRRIFVGYAGQMMEHKRPDFFLQIFVEAQKLFPELRALMAGDGPLLDAIIRQVEAWQLGDEVSILGRLDSMSDFYNSIDILVLTSTQEPFGRVIIEAMAYGKAVVAARVGGVPEVVMDGKTGYLVAANKLEDFVTRIVNLAEDDSLRQQMGFAGREFVLAHYSKERYCQELLTLMKCVENE